MLKLFTLALVMSLTASSTYGQFDDSALAVSTFENYLGKDLQWLQSRQKIDTVLAETEHDRQNVFLITGKIITQKDVTFDGFRISDIYFHIDSTGKTDALVYFVKRGTGNLSPGLKKRYGKELPGIKITSESYEFPETESMGWKLDKVFVQICDGIFLFSDDYLVVASNGQRTYLRPIPDSEEL
ncbi:MAG: hypothetical protein EOO02_21930 [Chitinophagaceae bacterium]|nr:MAG: hypothetical protein EOO02_21930 [Chitinophagaceae bacterium]